MRDIARVRSHEKEHYRQARQRVAKKLRDHALRLAFEEMMPDYRGEAFSALAYCRAMLLSRAALYDAALDIASNKPRIVQNLKR